MRFRCALLAAAALLGPSLADAQMTLSRGDRFFDTNLGVSFFTNDGPRFALLRNRKVLMVGMRTERVFSAGTRFAWAYSVELPVSMILPKANPTVAECWTRKTTQVLECYPISHPGRAVGAIGLTPIGFRLYYGPASRIRLFGALAGGFVAFDRSMPVTAGSALNFSAEYQLGAEFAVSDNRSIEVAWKFQHWSNANLTYFNPGLDVNLITLGLKRRR